MHKFQIKSVFLPVLIALLFLVQLSHEEAKAAKPKKILIAHRGASAYAPEHTLAAYRLAIGQGTDFVEQDLQITKDGVLICLHDLTLERTTNVKEIFPARFREEEDENGQKAKHWYAVDFTLAEIKQLDAGSWFGSQFKGESIPTFAEAISEIKDKAGLYPELKAPEFYRERGFEMEMLVLSELKKHDLDKPGNNKKTPVILQSFSDASLRRLAFELKTKLPLVLLIGLGDDKWLSAASILEVSQFAQSLGLAKEALTQEVVERVHRYDLTITVYTFSSKKMSKFPTVNEEMKHYLYKLGVDAIFTDNPDQFPREK